MTNEELCNLFDDELQNISKIFKQKQHDYGPENIAIFGEIGVLVRLSDKLERLKNLLLSGKEPNNESVEDTYDDISIYGQIAKLCRKNKWPNVQNHEIHKKV